VDAAYSIGGGLRPNHVVDELEVSARKWRRRPDDPALSSNAGRENEKPGNRAWRVDEKSFIILYPTRHGKYSC
jgi:hypothetical protein